ncbi:MAG: MFS transporter [Clostridia bacterium]|nr:MFS transporter [Clostridia bacterium]
MEEKTLEIYSRHNLIRAVCISCFRVVALLAANGALVQTLLVVMGYSERMIYAYTSLTQVANVLTMLLGAGYADKGGNVIRRAALLTVPQGVLCLFYLPLCFAKHASLGLFVYFVVISVLQTVAIGLYTLFDTKSSYHVYRPHNFGFMLAFCGILSNIISFFMGLLISSLTEKIRYSHIMLVAFLISAFLFLLSALLMWYQKSLLDPSQSGPKPTAVKLSYRQLLRYPVTVKLIPAHLLRGFSFGTTTVLAVICADLGFDAGVATSLVSVQSAAALLSCLTMSIVVRRFSSRLTVFIGSLLFLLFPLLLIPDKRVFLVVSFLIIFGRTFVDNGVVDVLLFAVPMEIAGSYNALRLLLHYAGILISTALAATVSVQALLIITAVCQVISGIMFFSMKLLRKVSPIRVRHESKES